MLKPDRFYFENKNKTGTLTIQPVGVHIYLRDNQGQLSGAEKGNIDHGG